MATEPNYDQIAFDISFTHLAQQGQPSVGVDGNCSYRGTGGCMCGIGPLIADDDYSPCMEGEAFSDSQIMKAIESKVGGTPSRWLLGSIQDTHDRGMVSAWRKKARSLAELGNLSTATIDALDWSACEATG